jgi:DNA-binding transcriptional ArsR family regulator
MKNEAPGKESSVYKVLSNPHRRRIIEIIGAEGKTSFTELNKDLQMSIGALYHHLDALGDLITQDDQHKYILTRRGKLAFKLLNETSDQLSSIRSDHDEDSGHTSNRLSYVVKIFLPRSVFLSVSDKPILYLPFTGIIVVLGAWVAVQANLRFLLVFPDNQTTSSPILMAIFFVFSLLTVFALSDIFSTLIFKRKGGDLSLLVGSSFSFLPLILFSGLWQLFKIVRFDTGGIITPVLILSSQLWTIGILSCSISFSKGLKMDRSALVSFMITYINIAIFLFGQIYR